MPEENGCRVKRVRPVTLRNVFVYVTQNIVSAVCPSQMKDWSKVTIETDPCVGVTRRALSDVMEKIKTEVNRLSKSGE